MNDNSHMSLSPVVRCVAGELLVFTAALVIKLTLVHHIVCMYKYQLCLY